MIKKGVDYVSNSEWNNIKTWKESAGREEVVNHAKDAEGEWTDEWKAIGRERWAKKRGHRGA